LSRESKPKQLHPLVGSRSLFQETFDRLHFSRDACGLPIVVCNERHRFTVSDQIDEIGEKVGAIVVEPVGRNTAPAIACAAMLALQGDVSVGSSGSAAKHEGQQAPYLLVLPADHVMSNGAEFESAVVAALEAASEERLVAFGVVPTRPETGYGYLRKGVRRGAWFELQNFVEKPDLVTAQNFLSSGQYLWNAGMFLFSVRRYLEELARFAPGIYRACAAALEAAVVDGRFVRLNEEFCNSPSDSIDYAVMEKTDHAAVVPLNASWSDVGSWDSLHDAVAKDGDGNALRGDVVALDCSNTYIVSTSRLVAAVGLEDLIVVETADAVLVLPRSRAQDVKKIVERLKSQGRSV
jgi:mannose-1-phosphate guanylyltransferase/mannose-6-phosphate isomerase